MFEHSVSKLNAFKDVSVRMPRYHVLTRGYILRTRKNFGP